MLQRRPFSHGAEFLLIGRNWDFNCRGADFTFVPAICESCYKNIRLRGWAPGAELETHLITSDAQGLTAVFGSVDGRGRSLPASPPGLWKRGCKGGAAAPFGWGAAAHRGYRGQARRPELVIEVVTVVTPSAECAP